MKKSRSKPVSRPSTALALLVTAAIAGTLTGGSSHAADASEPPPKVAPDVSPNAPPGAAPPAAGDRRAALACAVSSNCVNSFDTGGLAPLRFTGTPEQAMADLHKALATFPKTTIVHADALSMDTIFTTTVGFKDLVDFKIDPKAQRIDYRSRSSLGLYDFGKNRSRMTEFSKQFEKVSHP